MASSVLPLDGKVVFKSNFAIFLEKCALVIFNGKIDHLYKRLFLDNERRPDKERRRHSEAQADVEVRPGNMTRRGIRGIER